MAACTSSSSSPLLLLIVTTIITLFLSLPTIANATCNVAYEASCDAVGFTATSNVFFYVNRTESNKDDDQYAVTITYHWGVENVTIGPTMYNITEPYGLSSTYTYDNEGFYKIGYTLTFNDDSAAGCSGNTYDRFTALHVERTPNSCELNAKTPNPTNMPTLSSSPTITPQPTDPPVNGGERVTRIYGSGVVLGLVGVVLGSLIV